MMQASMRMLYLRRLRVMLCAAPCCAVALWLYLRDTSCLYAVQGKPLCLSVSPSMGEQEGACLPILSFLCMHCTCSEINGEHSESTDLPLLFLRSIPVHRMLDAGLALCYAVSSCISYIAL